MATSIVSGYSVLFIFKLVLLCLFTDAGKIDNFIKEASGGLPLLQLTNDGVRFNFAGYHAEAGLGGLLGDSKLGGGLHASAGTPFGPKASAGLGGILNGENASTGGGLFATADLGNNQPSAGAGLRGFLNGRQNYATIGDLIAGAGLGNNQPGVKTGLEGALIGNPNTPNDNNLANVTPTGHTNVQIISKSVKDGHKYRRAIVTKSIMVNEVVPESKYANANTDDVNDKNAIRSVQNNPVVRSDNNLVPAEGVVEAESDVNTAIGNDSMTTQEPPTVDHFDLIKNLRDDFFRKLALRWKFLTPISNPTFDTSSSNASGTVSAKSSDNFHVSAVADSNVN